MSFVGCSGVGKTTFLSRLLPVLAARGYHTAVIKHSPGHDARLARPACDTGKDTDRLYLAGASIVVHATPGRIVTTERVGRECTPQELAHNLSVPVDIVITEGYKHAGLPAIELVRSALAIELVADPATLVALITDADVRRDFPQAPQVPIFALDDATGVADLLESRFSLRPGQLGTR